MTWLGWARRGAAPLAAHRVAGERGPAIVARGSSLQARVSNLLALALMLGIGIGFLLWYYSRIAARPARPRQAAQQQLASRAQAEMALPALGPIPPPPAALAPAHPLPAVLVDAQVPLPQPAPLPLTPGVPGVAAVAPGPTALERRLSGAAFSSAQAADAAPEPGDEVSASAPPGAPMAATGQRPAAATESLSALLQAQRPAPVRAQLLPTQRWLLPKGAFIDCTLETAIDSTLPGLTTCVTATDTFGADGRVVLLDRGTKLIGETQGQVQQGAARVFVLWTEARTPNGVVVPLDSPGTDELGRSGLAGEVNRHFWQRFGAAILISTIDGATQAAVRSSGSGGTVVYSPSGSEQVTTEALRSTVNVAPTVTKRNGDRIQILVARDVDFSSVYELRHVEPSP